MYDVPLAVKCIYGCSHEGGNNEDGKEGRGLGLPGLLYVDNLVLCGEPEVLLVCRRLALKVNEGKSKVMMLNGEEGLECEIRVDRM